MSWLGPRLFALAVSLVLSAIGLELALRVVSEPPADWLEPQTKHLRSPLLGWVLPPGDRSYTIDAPVSVNSLGLRDDELSYAKPPGERRILCLGDSFTFALGVRFEDLYVQKLERLLNGDAAGARYQVINAGVAGYNTRQELLYLRAEGLRFEPDLISVGFYWNDLLGNGGPLPDVATTPLRAESQSFEEDSGHTLPPWLRNTLRRSRLLYLGVSRTKNALAAMGPPTEIARIQQALLEGDQAFLAPYWDATALRLRELADEGRKHGIPVILIAFPMENQILRHYPDMVWGERLREIWAATGMPFIDLEPAYRDALESGVNPFLPYDLHPGPAGMQIAAEAIGEVVHEHFAAGASQ